MSSPDGGEGVAPGGAFGRRAYEEDDPVTRETLVSPYENPEHRGAGNPSSHATWVGGCTRVAAAPVRGAAKNEHPP